MGFYFEGRSFGDAAFFPAFLLFFGEPGLGQEEPSVQKGVTLGAGISQEDAGLAVVDFAEAAAILALDADGFSSLFREIAAVDAEHACGIVEGFGCFLLMPLGENGLIPGGNADKLLK